MNTKKLGKTQIKTKLQYTFDLTKGMMILVTAIAVISIISSPGADSVALIIVRLIIGLVLAIPVIFGVSYLYVIFKYDELVQRDKELD
tara:strand:+ start:1286 stop:1549 length:264 start_codon:yes stop_codon:yes gene_type:complete